MKKITNNSSLSKLTILANGVVLVLFILSMVFLLNFNKTNINVISERNIYEKTKDENNVETAFTMAAEDIVQYKRK